MTYWCTLFCIGTTSSAGCFGAIERGGFRMALAGAALARVQKQASSHTVTVTHGTNQPAAPCPCALRLATSSRSRSWRRREYLLCYSSLAAPIEMTTAATKMMRQAVSLLRVICTVRANATTLGLRRGASHLLLRGELPWLTGYPSLLD